MPTAPDSTSPLLRTPAITTGDAAYPATLTVLLGRVTGRRGPSMMVREMAARQLEERRVDWGYSKPVVALDVMWNLAFVAVSLIMLICTVDEQPNAPIRLWVCGYALQCSLHVVLVWLEYSRRTVVPPGEVAPDHVDGEDEDARGGVVQIANQSSSKRFESVNTLASFLWWIAGFYWVFSGGEILLQNAPRLYWLTVVLLAFDVFFAIFCVVLACFIGIALCCCLPCIVAILYAVSGQEGASEADLCVLSKYKFEMCYDEENPIVGGGRMVPVETTSGVLPTERTLSPEDAECCICLSSYENGTELNALPCNHHFHSTCVLKWLKLNATCPLCKYNILKGSEQV